MDPPTVTQLQSLYQANRNAIGPGLTRYVREACLVGDLGRTRTRFEPDAGEGRVGSAGAPRLRRLDDPAERHGAREVYQVFVGRLQELRALDQALQAAAAGNPGLVVVQGEAGIGKTTLVHEFSERARSGGAYVLGGACVDLGGRGVPFAAVAQAVRPLVRDLPRAPEGLAPSVRRLRDLLLPSIGAPTIMTADTAPAVGVVHEAVLELLSLMGSSAPAVVVIDDVHWADRSTRDLVAFLARNLDHHRVLLVLAYRSAWLPEGHPARTFVAELVRYPAASCVSLGRFTLEEVTEQVQGLCEGRVDVATLRRLFARSEGNPFFTEVLLDYGGPDGDDVPGELRDLLLDGVALLSDPAKQLIRAAALGPPAVPGRLLADVCDMSPVELAAAMREAVGQFVLRIASADALAFRHALVREAVEQELVPSERLELHRRYATALEAQPGLGGDGVASEVAHHWDEAGDAPRALGAALRAAAASSQGHGHAEAAEHLIRALDLWSAVPDPVTAAGCDRVQLAGRAAEEANLAGEHGLAARLARVALEELDEERQPQRAAALQERLGRYLWATGDSRSASAAYERALELAPRGSPPRIRVRVLAARGQGLMLRALYRASRECCEEAVHLARSHQARAEEGHALNTLGFDVACLGDPDEGVRHLTESRRLAEEVGDIDDLLRAYVNLSEVLLHAADRAVDAVDVAVSGAGLSDTLGLSADYGVTLRANAASALHRLGKWRLARRILTEADGGGPVEVPAIDLHLCLARLLVDTGDVEEATARLTQARRLMTRTIDPQYVVPLAAIEAELALWQRRPDDGRRAALAALRALDGTDDVRLRGLSLWLAARATGDRVLTTLPQGREAQRR